MSEIELIEIAGVKPLYWSQFYCAFIDCFAINNGLICLACQPLKNAVEKRYEKFEKTIRRIIISYFSNTDEFVSRIEKSDNHRCWEELSWQYYKLGDVEKLHDLILVPEVFMYLKCERNAIFGLMDKN